MNKESFLICNERNSRAGSFPISFNQIYGCGTEVYLNVTMYCLLNSPWLFLSVFLGFGGSCLQKARDAAGRHVWEGKPSNTKKKK